MFEPLSQGSAIPNGHPTALPGPGVPACDLDGSSVTLCRCAALERGLSMPAWMSSELLESISSLRVLLYPAEKGSVGRTTRGETVSACACACACAVTPSTSGRIAKGVGLSAHHPD